RRPAAFIVEAQDRLSFQTKRAGASVDRLDRPSSGAVDLHASADRRGPDNRCAVAKGFCGRPEVFAAIRRSKFVLVAAGFQPVVFGRNFALSGQPRFLSLSSSKRRRGQGRGGAFYQLPLSPALCPLSNLAGGKSQECSRTSRPSDVLRAGTARAPVGAPRCAPSAARREIALQRQ